MFARSRSPPGAIDAAKITRKKSPPPRNLPASSVPVNILQAPRYVKYALTDPETPSPKPSLPPAGPHERTQHHSNPAAVSATSNTRKRKLLKVEDMVDVEAPTQRPLYTFSSPSFKKMINFAKKQAGPVQLKESFFNTSGGESDELDYKKASDVDVRAGISAYSGTGASADKSITAKERMDVILFRTKSLGKYWSFGVNIVDVDGENNRRFIIVEVRHVRFRREFEITDALRERI
ncbi:uncharacterized protein [Dermacentor andersoni]|uniref:uncharacterized protein n=1 Tax=Dermacentor andersoni TaxID=34620 RepID=UPI003B3B6212